MMIATQRSSGEGVTMPHDSEAIVEALLSASQALVLLSLRSVAAVNPNVTLRQFQTLAVLAVGGPQSVATLADKLGVHASTMSRMCDRLVTRGLLLRASSPHDHRAVILELSPAGTVLFDEVMRTRIRMMEAATQQIEPHTQSTAARAMHQFGLAARGGETGDATTDLDGVAVQLQATFPHALRT